ncbi:hypothetical protein F5X99DRAFT_428841 [Biscogniauxia marginata]|nr:hypothetical protein F5X99DRAFT_428841 [Biscogniauxia marginata]
MGYGLNLTNILPKAGLIYQSKWNVTQHSRHDEYIRKALQRVYLVNDSGKSMDKHESRSIIDNVLASNIMLATDQDMIDLLIDLEGDLGFLNFCDALLDRIDWAKKLNERAFYDFIFQLIEARKEWKKSPRPPFNLEEHSATARAIDGFLEAAGRRWDSACAEFEIFCACDGLGEDESDSYEDGDNTTMCGTGEDEEGTDKFKVDMRSLGDVLDDEMRTEEMVSEMDKMNLD